jgi:hypothetical protein
VWGWLHPSFFGQPFTLLSEGESMSEEVTVEEVAQSAQAEQVSAEEHDTQAVEAPAVAAEQAEAAGAEEVVEPKFSMPEAAEEKKKEEQVQSHSGELHTEMVQRLGQLESRIKVYEEKEKEREVQVVAEKSAAREKLLEGFGILDGLYGKLAPSIEEADPRTEEGREQYRQWMVKNPALFKKSPTMEKIKDATKEPNRQGNVFRKHVSFSEAIRKIKG